MSPAHTELVVARERPGTYALRGHRHERASLRLGWLARRGEIRTGEGAWPVRRRGFKLAIAGDADQPLVRLGRDEALVPGGRGDERWAIAWRRGVYIGALTRDDAAITLRLGGLLARRCDVEATGEWERRDLVVLTACFALLVRRARAIIIASGGSN